VSDLVYPPVIGAARVAFAAMGLRFTVRGSEHVPRTGGAVMAINHTGYLDFTFAGLAARPSRRLVRFMCKQEIFEHPVGGPLMRGMHHIPVDREAGMASYATALRVLRDGEVVGVFPEATISTSFTVKDLKAGVARMAVDAGVPIIPAAVWGGHRIATKGHKVDLRRDVPVTVILGSPLLPEPGEKPQALLRRTRAAMEALLDEAQRTYPDQPAGPDDRWWLPAHLGGTAPTPEEAAAKDAIRASGQAAKVRTPSPLARLRALVTRR
jgi:1-acyl-sn-glycerol-3-phosphate acyltransferase